MFEIYLSLSCSNLEDSCKLKCVHSYIQRFLTFCELIRPSICAGAVLLCALSLIQPLTLSWTIFLIALSKHLLLWRSVLTLYCICTIMYTTPKNYCTAHYLRIDDSSKLLQSPDFVLHLYYNVHTASP